MPWPIVGNERAVSVLASAVANDSLQHAYLFSGPERLGRATVARLLAQAVNCTGDIPPCGECGQCQRIAKGIHPDILTVTVEPDDDGKPRTTISIEQLRKVERAVSLNPYEGRSRVVIIDPADLMGQAQSAFLKTLEEPPPHVVFVLITANEDGLLETIRSRCTRIEFNLVPVAEIERALIDRGSDAEVARLLARLSAGRPGWALAAVADPKLLERRHEALETARSLPQMSLADRFEFVERLTEAFRKERDPVFRTLEDWRSWWRDVFLVQSGAEETVANVDMLEALDADASSWPRADVLTLVRSLGDTRAALIGNVQTRIALDALMMDVPRAPGRTRR